jgi:hypothetical protein
MRLQLHSEHQLAPRPGVPSISAGLMRKEGIGSMKEARRKAAVVMDDVGALLTQSSFGWPPRRRERILIPLTHCR